MEDLVQCETCRESGPRSEMRVKGARLDGSLRYRHRIGFGCQQRARLTEETTALDVRSQDFHAAFYDPERGYNLTALWRAAGRPVNKAPQYWLRTEEGQAWIDMIPDHISSARGVATWFDDIQPALQYAAYLDPALREDVFDRYVQVKTTTQQITIWQPDEHGMRALVREEVHAEFLQQEERLEGRTIRHDILIDRPVDGRVYIAEEDPRNLRSSTSRDVLRYLDKGWRYLFISQTARNEDERMAEYMKKRAHGTPPPIHRKTIVSDARRKLETTLHNHRPPQGVWKVPGKKDEFMVSPEAYECLMELPSYIGSLDIARLRHWVLQQQIFID